MKFDKRKNPAQVVAKEPTRYATQGVAVVEHAGKTFVAATDGRGLTMIEATLEEGDSTARGVTQAEAIAAARKSARSAQASLSLGAKADTVRTDGATTEFQQMDVRFPDVTGVVPTGSVRYKVTLNAALLAQMQKAFDGDAVTLEFGLPDEPMRVTPDYANGSKAIRDASFGVLMPWSS